MVRCVEEQTPELPKVRRFGSARAGEELPQARGAVRAHHEGEGRLHHQRHRQQVRKRIEAQVAAQRRQGGDGGGGDEEGVAVRCLRDVLHAHQAARARPALEDHGLAELRREGVHEEAPRHVLRAAGREGADQPDRTRGPGGRLRERGGGQPAQ
jgi:hypothetical protein